MSVNRESIVAGKPLRSNDIRQRNERLVLNLIYAHSSGISQSEIVAITGLKPPTVFRIFSELEAKGIIRVCNEDKEQPDRKGRRPSYYCVNPDSFCAIELDFSSYSASIVVVDFAGGVVHQDSSDFPAGVDAPAVNRKLKSLIRRAIDSSGVSEGRILGIGVGAPGIVDTVGGRVVRYPRILSMSDFPIGDILHSAFGLPVYIHNNCAVVALSEQRYRKLDASHSIFAFLIRSGVGGAFIQDGAAFVNHDMTALEVGHFSVDAKGNQCECGARGCLETYLNEEKILSYLAAQAGCSNWDEIERRLVDRDKTVIAALREFSSLLVYTATNVANLLNPNAFLVVTRYEHLAEFFAEELRSSFAGKGHLLPITELEVVGRKYDPILACKGACDLVFDHFFQEAI